MDFFRPELETCPCCGAKGNCHIHAYYSRGIVDFINGKPVKSEVVILRLICDCGATHAILPDFIIPYSGYRLFFILRILAEGFARISSVERLCERFSVTRNQFYKCLNLWNTQKEEWLGTLASMETSGLSFLKYLIRMPAYSAFASEFVCRFRTSFLHCHQNLAHYCQRVFDP